MTAALLLQIALKASIVLAAAWVLTRAMTRFSAGARHLVWLLALLAALAMPAGTAVRPRVESGHTAFVSSRSGTRGRGSTNRTCFGYASDRERGRRCYRRRACERYAADAGGGCCIDPAPVAAPQRPRGGTRLGHNATLLWIWGTGTLLVLLRLVAGLVWAVWLTRQARPIEDPDWRDLLDISCASLGLPGRVQLRTSPRTSVPMATGLWRPVVMLPPDSDRWSEERRRVVLQHELAHVKRGDCLGQALAQIALAFHWFNPIAASGRLATTCRTGARVR